MSYNSRLSPNREGTHKHLGIGNISPRPSNRRVSWRLHLPGPLSIKISHYTNINNNTNININRKLFGGGGVSSRLFTVTPGKKRASVPVSISHFAKSAPTQIQDEARRELLIPAAATIHLLSSWLMKCSFSYNEHVSCTVPYSRYVPLLSTEMYFKVVWY